MVVAIAVVLAKSRSLESLEVPGFGEESAMAPSYVLDPSMSHEELDSLHTIGNEEGMAMADALTQNQCLRLLSLPLRRIGDGGAIVLAGALTKNQCLEHLGLEWNRIGVRGATALGDALKKNRFLKSLNLCVNQIRDQGALAIASGLRQNKSLKSLNVVQNGIGDSGAVGLAEMLRSNSVLKCLELRKNSFTENGRKALCCAMQHNCVLESLKLPLHPPDCPWSRNMLFQTHCNCLDLWDVDENDTTPWHKAFYVLLNGRHVPGRREEMVESYRLSFVYMMLQNRPEIVMRWIRKRPRRDQSVQSDNKVRKLQS